MTSFLQDLRFGIRLLGRQPGFTGAAVLVLTLGIGSNVAIFSIANELLLKPRPGGVDSQLVGVYSRDLAQPDVYRAFSYAEFAALRERRDLFRSLSAHDFGLVGLTEGDTVRRAFADIVTADFFDTFGVAPRLGRGFSLEEERPGADIPVVIVSHAAWRRLGGTEDVVGRQLILNTRAFTIVGVAPERFGGSMVVASPELWVPTGVYDSLAYEVVSEGRTSRLSDPGRRSLIVVGRLHDGQTIESAAPAVEVLSRQRQLADPVANRDQAIELARLSRLAVSTEPQTDAELLSATTLLMACAAVVLLIASFNLANMLLARGRARRREFAIRMAIGGGRWRIVRQLLTENFVLALIGGAGGLLLSWWAIRLVTVALPASLPINFALEPSLDVRVLAATLVCCILGTLVSGLMPALTLVRGDTSADLRAQTHDSGEGRRGPWRWLTTRDALVTGQLALTLVMLSSAGLFLRGSIEAARSDPGFTLDRGIVINTDTSLAGYDPSRTTAVYRDMLARLRAMPRVEAAGFGSLMPFGEFSESREVQRAGAPIPASDPRAETELITATATSIGAGYFGALGVPMLRGREFTEAETFATDGEGLAILDVELARQLFGARDPLGEFVQFTDRDAAEATRLRVVGVAGGVRANLFDAGPTPHLYTTFGRDYRASMHFHVRTAAPTAAAEAEMLPALRQMLRDLDPRLPIVSLETRAMFRDRNLVVWMVSAAAGLTGALALAALIVAVIGVYGVKAYLVARRTREIGVRVALGATRRDVFTLVFRDGLAVTLTGLALGLTLSLAAGQAMRSLLFQGRAFDLAVVAAALGSLVVAGLLATWIPAARALRISPTRALRTD